jgi:hypothetical protein
MEDLRAKRLTVGSSRISPAELVRQMSKHVVEHIQHDLGSKQVTLEEFVGLITSHLATPRDQLFGLVECLCCFFCSADTDFSHKLTWPEIANYVLLYEHRKEGKSDNCRFKVSPYMDQMMHGFGTIDLVHVSREELLVCEHGAKTMRYLRLSNPMREERRHLSLDFSGVQQRRLNRRGDDDGSFNDEDEEWPPHPEEVRPLRMGWDPDEQYACGITARANCRLIFWECGLTYKLKYRIKCQPAQTGVWYSRTAKCWFSAATGTANFVITAWNMKEQRRISQLHGHQGVVPPQTIMKSK